MIEYGKAPVNLGIVELKPTECMYYLYLPIGIEEEDFWCYLIARLPQNLHFMYPLLEAIESYQTAWSGFRYAYITAKTMFVGPGCPGNREGWHADGFGSNGDINYIWANMNPTEFAIQEFKDISTDDRLSMQQFAEQAKGPFVTYPNCSLLRLDEGVIHRVNEHVEPGLRTFIKITFSNHKFNNFGNSYNYRLDYEWEMLPRTVERNLDSKQ